MATVKFPASGTSSDAVAWLFAAQDKLQAAAFGAAAAFLLSATPAFAGVTLEQPKLRKVRTCSIWAGAGNGACPHASLQQAPA